MKYGKSDDAIIQALRSKGYKATPQRITICKITLSSREHPNIQKIYTETKKAYPTVSLATVYSTLNILKESSLIQELNYPQGQTRYDPYLEPHINLVCLNCGKIQDINEPEIKEVLKTVCTKTQFTSTTQRIDVYGVCQQCSKNHQ
jgi:Fur family peroxide stress response transcriptional regulator